MVKFLILLFVLAARIAAQNNSGSEIINKHLPGINIIVIPDSVQPNYRYKHSTLNLSLQTIVGEGMGLGLAFIPFLTSVLY